MKQVGCCNSFEGDAAWVILSPIEQSIKQKIEAVGTPLKDWDIQINYGIKTGCNEAFIVSTEKRNEILANCQTEEERKRTEELIRPILRGRDIKRYGYNWANLWLINTHNGIRGKLERIHIENYPAVKEHLDQYWDKISKRADKGDTPYNLRNCAYLDFYIPVFLSLLVLDKFLHQLLISARFLIAQIVALVYHDQNLLSRLKIAQLGIGVSLLHTVVLHIGMKTDDVVELILLETGVATTEILVPVLLQLLRTEQDCEIILSLEIFDDRQCRESFTKTHSIGKDSSIILSEHFYQRNDSFLLIIEKRVPNHTGLQKLHILSVFNTTIQVEIGIEQLEEYLIIDFLWCIFTENFLYLLDKVLFYIYLSTLRFLSILWHFSFATEVHCSSNQERRER